MKNFVLIEKMENLFDEKIFIKDQISGKNNEFIIQNKFIEEEKKKVEFEKLKFEKEVEDFKFEKEKIEKEKIEIKKFENERKLGKEKIEKENLSIENLAKVLKNLETEKQVELIKKKETIKDEYYKMALVIYGKGVSKSCKSDSISIYCSLKLINFDVIFESVDKLEQLISIIKVYTKKRKEISEQKKKTLSVLYFNGLAFELNKANYIIPNAKQFNDGMIYNFEKNSLSLAPSLRPNSLLPEIKYSDNNGLDISIFDCFNSFFIFIFYFNFF
jgi:hypothetical protein